MLGEIGAVAHGHVPAGEVGEGRSQRLMDLFQRCAAQRLLGPAAPSLLLVPGRTAAPRAWHDGLTCVGHTPSCHSSPYRPRGRTGPLPDPNPTQRPVTT